MSTDERRLENSEGSLAPTGRRQTFSQRVRSLFSRDSDDGESGGRPQSGGTSSDADMSQAEAVVSDSVRQLSSKQTATTRMTAVAELTRFVGTHKVSLTRDMVTNLWLASRDMLQEGQPPQLQDKGFQLLAILAEQLDEGASDMRLHFFQVLRAADLHTHSESLVESLAALTNYGQRIHPFADYITPFILELLPEAAACDKLRTMLFIIKGLVMSNMAEIPPTARQSLVICVCGICNMSAELNIIMPALDVMYELVSACRGPVPAMTEFVATVCRVICVHAVSEKPVNIVLQLFTTEKRTALATLRILLDLMRTSDVPSNRNLVRGAIFILSLVSWRDMKAQVKAIDIRPELVLPPFHRVAKANDYVVSVEILSALDALVTAANPVDTHDDPRAAPSSAIDVSSLSWAHMLDICLTIEEYGVTTSSGHAADIIMRVLQGALEQTSLGLSFGMDKMLRLVNRICLEYQADALVMVYKPLLCPTHPAWRQNLVCFVEATLDVGQQEDALPFANGPDKEDSQARGEEQEHRVSRALEGLHLLLNQWQEYKHVYADAFVDLGIIGLLSKVSRQTPTPVAQAQIALLSEMAKTDGLFEAIFPVLVKLQQPSPEAEDLGSLQATAQHSAILGLTRLFRFYLPQSLTERTHAILAALVKSATSHLRQHPPRLPAGYMDLFNLLCRLRWDGMLCVSLYSQNRQEPSRSLYYRLGFRRDSQHASSAGSGRVSPTAGDQDWSRRSSNEDSSPKQSETRASITSGSSVLSQPSPQDVSDLLSDVFYAVYLALSPHSPLDLLHIIAENFPHMVRLYSLLKVVTIDVETMALEVKTVIELLSNKSSAFHAAGGPSAKSSAGLSGAPSSAVAGNVVGGPQGVIATGASGSSAAGSTGRSANYNRGTSSAGVVSAATMAFQNEELQPQSRSNMVENTLRGLYDVLATLCVHHGRMSRSAVLAIVTMLTEQAQPYPQLAMQALSALALHHDTKDMEVFFPGIVRNLSRRKTVAKLKLASLEFLCLMATHPELRNVYLDEADNREAFAIILECLPEDIPSNNAYIRALAFRALVLWFFRVPFTTRRQHMDYVGRQLIKEKHRGYVSSAATLAMDLFARFGLSSNTSGKTQRIPRSLEPFVHRSAARYWVHGTTLTSITPGMFPNSVMVGSSNAPSSDVSFAVLQITSPLASVVWILTSETLTAPNVTDDVAFLLSCVSDNYRRYGAAVDSSLLDEAADVARTGASSAETVGASSLSDTPFEVSSLVSASERLDATAEAHHHQQQPARAREGAMSAELSGSGDSSGNLASGMFQRQTAAQPALGNLLVTKIRGKKADESERRPKTFSGGEADKILQAREAVRSRMQRKRMQPLDAVSQAAGPSSLKLPFDIPDGKGSQEQKPSKLVASPELHLGNDEKTKPMPDVNGLSAPSMKSPESSTKSTTDVGTATHNHSPPSSGGRLESPSGSDDARSNSATAASGDPFASMELPPRPSNVEPGHFELAATARRAAKLGSAADSRSLPTSPRRPNKAGALSQSLERDIAQGIPLRNRFRTMSETKSHYLLQSPQRRRNKRPQSAFAPLRLPAATALRLMGSRESLTDGNSSANVPRSISPPPTLSVRTQDSGRARQQDSDIRREASPNGSRRRSSGPAQLGSLMRRRRSLAHKLPSSHESPPDSALWQAQGRRRSQHQKSKSIDKRQDSQDAQASSGSFPSDSEVAHPVFSDDEDITAALQHDHSTVQQLQEHVTTNALQALSGSSEDGSALPARVMRQLTDRLMKRNERLFSATQPGSLSSTHDSSDPQHSSLEPHFVHQPSAKSEESQHRHRIDPSAWQEHDQGQDDDEWHGADSFHHRLPRRPRVRVLSAATASYASAELSGVSIASDAADALPTLRDSQMLIAGPLLEESSHVSTVSSGQESPISPHAVDASLDVGPANTESSNNDVASGVNREQRQQQRGQQQTTRATLSGGSDPSQPRTLNTPGACSGLSPAAGNGVTRERPPSAPLSPREVSPKPRSRSRDRATSHPEKVDSTTMELLQRSSPKTSTRSAKAFSFADEDLGRRRSQTLALHELSEFASDTLEDNQPSADEAYTIAGHVMLQLLPAPFNLAETRPIRFSARASPKNDGGARPVNRDDFDRLMRLLANVPPQSTHRIGVVYVGPGQSGDGDAMLRNTGGSVRYTKFLQSLGSLLKLRGCRSFTGGLDTKADTDGAFTYAWQEGLTSVAFHVATLIPNLENDPKLLNKKRLIGNDYVTVVYNDSRQKFVRESLQSGVNLVYLVVEPVDEDNFKVTTKVKSSKKAMDFEISPQRERLVSSANIGLFIRQLAIHADIAAMAQNKRQSNWQQRLTLLQKLKDLSGPTASSPNSETAASTPGSTRGDTASTTSSVRHSPAMPRSGLGGGGTGKTPADEAGNSSNYTYDITQII